LTKVFRRLKRKVDIFIVTKNIFNPSYKYTIFYEKISYSFDSLNNTIRAIVSLFK